MSIKHNKMSSDGNKDKQVRCPPGIVEPSGKRLKRVISIKPQCIKLNAELWVKEQEITTVPEPKIIDCSTIEVIAASDSSKGSNQTPNNKLKVRNGKKTGNIGKETGKIVKMTGQKGKQQQLSSPSTPKVLPFRKLLDRTRRVVVKTEDGSDITDFELIYIEKYISQEIEKQLQNDKVTVGPQISLSGVSKGGWYGLTCANIRTINWLESLSPIIIGDRRFRVIRLSKLPQKFKASTFIRNFKKNDMDLLKYIKKQNPELKTELWNITDRKEKSQGVSFSFKIDEDSANSLANMNFHPYFIAEQINIKVHGIRIVVSKID